MKIKNKLLIGYLIVVSFVLIIGYVGAEAISSFHHNYDKITSETLPAIEILEDIKFSSLRIVSSTSEFGFITNEKKAIQKGFDGFKESENDEEILIKEGISLFDKNVEEYEILTDNFSTDDKKILEEIKQSGNKIKSISSEIINLKKQDISGREVFELKEELEKYEIHFLELTDRLINKRKNEITAQHEALELLIQASVKNITGTSLLIVIIGIVLSLTISRLIAKPISRLSHVAAKVGEGHLEVQATIDSKDEIGDLAKTFNEMIKNLKRSQDELKRYRDDLEKLVSERTEDIKIINQELKREIVEREKTENLLRHAQKMEAIGVLAGGIAHDFNNILAAILGYAEIIRDDLPKGNQSSEDIQEVIKAGNRAKELIRHILTFSRQTDHQLIPLEPVPIVKEVIKLIRAALPTTIEIKSDIDTQCGNILADPTKIHQIIMNLCTNAAHAMDEKGGILEISLKETYLTSDDVQNHPNTKPGHFLQLLVRDTGHGMDKAVKDRIFDPYFTTKDIGKGSGMGLATVHGIVQEHRGMIKVESETGKGSTFSIFFPVIDEEGMTAGEEISEPLPTGKERVLLVEDEIAVAQITKEILDRLGYHTTPKNSSVEALELFRSQPEKFDLVITDQTMPHMTGAELAKEFLLIRADIPIILCSGYSEKIDAAKAKALGICRYIMKPVVMRDLAKSVREVLDA